MANHIRRQVREAVKNLLTGLPTTGVRVYASRLQPLDDEELPCLTVNTDNENLSVYTINSNPTIDRQLNITVRAFAKVNAVFDDVIDEMIKEIEQAVNASVSTVTLGGLVKFMALKNIEINYDAEGEKPVAEAIMQFEANYLTAANAPDISI